MRVTDQGRVFLGSQIGEGVQQLEADLDSATNAAFFVRVRATTNANGRTQQWSGELLTLPGPTVTNVRERRFSTRRTALAVGAGVGGFVAFVVSRSLLGKGGNERDAPGGPPTDQ